MRFLSEDFENKARERFLPLGNYVHSGAGEKTFAEVLKIIEVVGVAGTMSYANARHASPGRQAYEIAGVPADLALGLLFTGLAVTGYFGSQAVHGHNVGNGFLAAYACRMGTMWGGAAKAQLAGAPSVRGEFGPSNSVGHYPTHPHAHAAGQEAFPWS